MRLQTIPKTRFWLALTLLVAIAAGCAAQRPPHEFDSSPARLRDAVIGSVIRLQQPLEVRAGSNRVAFQLGHVRRGQPFNLWEPTCALMLAHNVLESEQPRRLHPDRFVVMASHYEIERKVDELFIRRTRLELGSVEQPDVKALVCETWNEVSPDWVAEKERAIGAMSMQQLPLVTGRYLSFEQSVARSPSARELH